MLEYWVRPLHNKYKHKTQLPWLHNKPQQLKHNRLLALPMIIVLLVLPQREKCYRACTYRSLGDRDSEDAALDGLHEYRVVQSQWLRNNRTAVGRDTRNE